MESNPTDFGYIALNLCKKLDSADIESAYIPVDTFGRHYDMYIVNVELLDGELEKLIAKASMIRQEMLADKDTDVS